MSAVLVEPEAGARAGAPTETVADPRAEAAAALARWAVAFEAKLAGLAGDLDASWRAPLLDGWAFLEALPPARAAALQPRLWRDRLLAQGDWPALDIFSDPLARLGLLPRGDLLQRLCLLALARRPGVLRCCIDRTVRAPLQRALGEDFGVLASFSLQGRPVEATQAAWSPVQWACVGFSDWRAALLGDARRMATLVRWSLPREPLDAVLNGPPVAAERSVPAAIAALAHAEVVWPC